MLVIAKLVSQRSGLSSMKTHSHSNIAPNQPHPILPCRNKGFRSVSHHIDPLPIDIAFSTFLSAILPHKIHLQFLNFEATVAATIATVPNPDHKFVFPVWICFSCELHAKGLEMTRSHLVWCR